MRLVVDASVAVKWFLRSSEGESDVAASLELLRGVFDERLQLVQPPHFIAEVSAVLAREMPGHASAWLRDLLDVEMQVIESEVIYSRAVALSRRLRHHVFDTLYHAVALETPDAMLVTADNRYERSARPEGRILRLAEFRFAS